MCNFKSLLLTKDKVLCPDDDNHSRMIAELNLRDTELMPNFIKIEVTPPGGDPFIPLEQWIYRIDQDFIPDWYAEEIDKARVMVALSDWAAKHIYVGVNGLSLTEGAGYCLKDCKDVTLAGNSRISRMDGSSRIDLMAGSSRISRMAGSSRIDRMDGSSRIDLMAGSSRIDLMDGSSRIDLMDGNSRIDLMAGSSRIDRMDGSSRIDLMDGNSRIGDVYNKASIRTARGESSITTLGPVQFDWENKGALILSENASYRNCIERTIYQSGDWRLALIAAESAIGGGQP